MASLAISPQLRSLVPFHMSSVIIRSKHVLGVISLRARRLQRVCTHCQVSVAPHQNTSERALRGCPWPHVHKRSSAGGVCGVGVTTTDLPTLACSILLHPYMQILKLNCDQTHEH